MSVIIYPAEITRDAEGGFRGRFLDFVGVDVTAGSPGELLRLARERLSAELQRLEGEGESWPEPSPVGAPAAAGASVMLVDISVDDTPIRLNISLGERLLRRIDQDAEARSMTRSGYLALGARRLLGDAVEPPGGIGGETGQRLQEEIAALGRRVTETLGPNSPVGRTLSELDAIALDGLRRLGGEVRSAMTTRSRQGGGTTAPPTGDRSAAEPSPSDPVEPKPGV